VAKSIFGGEAVKKERVRLRSLRHQGGPRPQFSRHPRPLAPDPSLPRAGRELQPITSRPLPRPPDQEAPTIPRGRRRRHRLGAAHRPAVLLVPPLRYRGRGPAGGGGAPVGCALRARGGAGGRRPAEMEAGGRGAQDANVGHGSDGENRNGWNRTTIAPPPPVGILFCAAAAQVVILSPPLYCCHLSSFLISD
jgi:hypothetical protein